jgi:D-tyrosyl-tRNA(Tyr) deacylase
MVWPLARHVKPLFETPDTVAWPTSFIRALQAVLSPAATAAVDGAGCHGVPVPAGGVPPEYNHRAMRVLIQRVARASVTVDGSVVGTVGRGFLALVGVTHNDTRADAERLAARTFKLRVFEDDAGLMNLGLADVRGEVLAVSQFTLYADTRKGNRPSFTEAAPAGLGEELYGTYVAALRDAGVPVATGEFGARMEVALVNDGPVTVLLEEPR